SCASFNSLQSLTVIPTMQIGGCESQPQASLHSHRSGIWCARRALQIPDRFKLRMSERPILSAILSLNPIQSCLNG
ncbi:MAG TPA: hypothetical protein V6C78_10230, partial [Crinalium sp.]